MGQQQLLLLVLGIVIVGLAVVVGIEAFSENQKKANSDAMVNDGIRIASDAQAWKLKPQAFGGGASASGFTGVTFNQLGYTPNSSGNYDNLNGEFVVTTANASSLVLTGSNTVNSNYVRVGVYGTTPECIVTSIASSTSDLSVSTPDATNCTL